MAVDLVDLIPDLLGQINPPGSDLFPDAGESDWIIRLRNGFWDARLDGMLEGYTEADGLVSPLSGTEDIPRDLQQLVIFYAAFSIVLNELRNSSTKLRTKAGAAEFEQEKSANLLTGLLAQLKDRKALILTRLSDVGYAPVAVIDSILARDASIRYGDTWF